jgi:hypothetical protein
MRLLVFTFVVVAMVGVAAKATSWFLDEPTEIARTAHK